MADAWWKAIERRVAAFFATVRTPLSGSSGKVTASDTHHPRLFIEIKARAQHSAVTLWRQTRNRAIKEEKIPVVVMAERGRHGFWVLCHSGDLADVAEELRGVKECGGAAKEAHGRRK
jgi:hypothetical protein